MFKALIGDLFSSKMQTLVNTINCVGVMGKGVALEFKKRFPVLVRSLCGALRSQGGIGWASLTCSSERTTGTYSISQRKGHWRSPSRLADIESGLDHFVKHYAEWGIEASLSRHWAAATVAGWSKSAR